MNGFIKSELTEGNQALQLNLKLIKDALSKLISSDDDFRYSIQFFPKILAKALNGRRAQAKRFLADFYSRECPSA